MQGGLRKDRNGGQCIAVRSPLLGKKGWCHDHRIRSCCHGQTYKSSRETNMTSRSAGNINECTRRTSPRCGSHIDVGKKDLSRAVFVTSSLDKKSKSRKISSW